MTEEKAQKELDKRDYTEELKGVFSLKWVEKVVFWFIVLIATGVFTIIITNYILNYVHIPK
jgi:hypothetical protein